MEQACPKCGYLTESFSPNKPWYLEFICDECACCWDETGNILYYGMPETEAKPFKEKK